ncbi:MAG: AraC family transcriptional regulator [Exilibacterium sp.]
MSITSDWPLPKNGIRFLTPKQLLSNLVQHPLTASLYPVAMGYYPSAHQHRMRRLNHDDYLLIYCTAGEGLLETENLNYRIRSGDIILLPKNISHFYQADCHRPWTIYWLHFDGSLAAAFAKHLNLSSLCQNIGLHPRVIASFDNLCELRNSGYQLAAFIHGCHQLQALLSYLSLLMRQQLPRHSKIIDLGRIESIMRENLHNQLDLQTLAEQIKLSKYHFSKKFKHLVGQSPIQYFINMKMQHACLLLDSSPRSVKQISAELGYDDVYYFSRLFKKVIGLSPGQYRSSKYR